MMTKRIFSALLAAALSLSLLAGCGSTSGSTASSAADGPQRYSTVFYDVFDTVTQVIAYCDSEEEFTAQMDALHADLVEYNQLYDIYNDYDGVTNIKTINDNAGTAPVTVDDKILGMLELAQTMYDTTGGKLNIALGSVLNIWHNYREAALADDNDSNNQLPTQEELDAAAQHCDIANLIIDEDAKTVYLADPAMSLDVGSVGRLRRGAGRTGRRSPGPDQCPHQRGRQPAGHRHQAGRLPVGRRRGKPVELLRGLHQRQLHCSRRQDERPFPCDQRRLPALLRCGRCALPPPHRPGHPLARRLL